LEYGDSNVLVSDNGLIAGGYFEGKLACAFESALALLKRLQVDEPVFASLTLVGVNREIILCPDISIQNMAEKWPYQSSLMPIINSLWQAAGLEKSPYLDQIGSWSVTRQ
jgi:hypothetical protein